MSSSAPRVKRHRERRKAGIRTFRLEVPAEVVKALEARSWITNASDHQEVTDYLEDILHCWARGTLTVTDLRTNNDNPHM